MSKKIEINNMGLAASSNKTKADKEDITFCVVCYENEIETLKLDCGHAFCNGCILSLHEYEMCPRCPLCRQYIRPQTKIIYDDVEKESGWLAIGLKTANLPAFVAFLTLSCCLFCYSLLPLMQRYFQGWDLTMLHGLLNDIRIECGRMKEDWFY